MSFKDEVIRGRNQAEERQYRENLQIELERTRYWDSFYKARVKDFALETNNPDVIYWRDAMLNNKNTDSFYSENNYKNT